MLSSNGIDHPVMNVFRMLSKMKGERIAVNSSAGVSTESIEKNGVRGIPDVSALAAATPSSVSILAWNYHDDDIPGPVAEVKLELSHLSAADGELI